MENLNLLLLIVYVFNICFVDYSFMTLYKLPLIVSPNIFYLYWPFMSQIVYSGIELINTGVLSFYITIL